ncbi:MAG: tail fiber domain-containing protein [Bryobacteraceae bacterium]
MNPNRARHLICILALAPVLAPAQVVPEPQLRRQPDLAQQAGAKPAPKPELAFSGAVSTNALSFVAITPCRLIDTHQGDVPVFSGAFGPPSLLPSFPRNFPLPLASCGLPTDPAPQAYSLSVTVVPIAGASPKGGFIVVYPGIAGPSPGLLPYFASLVWQGNTVYLSNAVIVAANPTDGSVYIDSNVKTDVIVDINGYFAAPTDSNTGNNTALGYQSLQANTAGTGNTANGYQALETNSVGIANTASGSQSLQANTTGTANTASGFQALEANTTGQGNTAVGFQALSGNLMGINNTAIGSNALLAATGNYNTALGFNAGSNLGEGSNNILIGNPGTPDDGMGYAVIRIGYLQSRTFIDGIRGKTTGLADAVPVVIDSNGQLGTVNSSARFKEDIQDMASASSGLLRLRPVTYRYKQPYADGSKPIDYGLIAEEVAQVYPDLVVTGEDGLAQTVQYQKLTPMLLNELQKQNLFGQMQNEIIQLQENQIQQLETRLAALEAALSSGKIPKEKVAP